ncbi:hypothetical protein INT44_006003, partial [Umbelopsis vinacea]
EGEPNVEDKIQEPTEGKVERIATTSSDNQVYSIHSKTKKRLLCCLAASAGFLSPFTANIYFPALNNIQKDLGVSAELVNLTITIFMICQGASPSFWGTIADSWGRRPVYLATLLIYIGGCIGVALTPNYGGLLALRMVQAFGSSSVVAIGAGTIGDICTPSERAGYMGIFSATAMLGPVIGPVVGGVVSQQLGWRWIFWVLAILGAVMWLLLFFFLSETLRSLVGNGSGYANPTPTEWLRRRALPASERVQPPPMTRFLTIPNPFIPFMYILEKDVFCLLLYNSLQYFGFYAVLTSMTSLFSVIYGLNDMQIGLCYMANGFGCVCGSLTTGRLLNWEFQRVVKKLNIDPKRARRGRLDPSFPIERTRMHYTWIWGLIYNVFLIVYGWALQYHAPLAVVLVFQVFLGYCSTATFSATSTLLVDLFPKNSAAIVASNNLARCWLGAIAVVGIAPGIERLGVGWMLTLISLILFFSRILMMVELKYGPTWRQQRAERTELKEKKKADKKEAKLQAKLADQEKQQSPELSPE